MRVAFERVGLDYIKKHVVDDAGNRRALFERLMFALEGLPDPWATRIAGAQKREYTPLKLAPQKPDRQIAVALEE